MANWLDFRAIKHGVSLKSVLQHYGVELRRSGPAQYRGCCPIHRGEGRDAFQVNLARNIFHCFACGADGTVLDFVVAMEGCALREAAERNCELASFAPGHLSAECGRAALEYVRRATQMCLADEADALVTAPVNKEAVAMTGEPFTGHTEFIADLCHTPESRMLLVNDSLRVVHVSTHVALQRACKLDTEQILRTLELGCEGTRLLGDLRSSSATAPRMVKTIFPVGVLVSICSDKETKSIPRASF